MSSKSKLSLEASPTAAPSALQQPRSLRLRLALWYGALVVITIGSFAILVFFLTSNAMNQSIEASVTVEAQRAISNIQQELLPTPPYWPTQLSLKSIDIYRDPGVAVEIRDTSRVLHYPHDTGNARIPFTSSVEQALRTKQSLWFTTTIEGEHVRILASPILVHEDVIGVLLVAKSLEDVDHTLFQLQTLLLLASLLVSVVALFGGWLLATRVLRPLSDIVKTAHAIAHTTAHGTRLGNLSQRVPRPAGRDEMAQVIDTFNEMLTDLESATRMQRRFVADASHELRAPLTSVQGNLAFLLRHLEDVPIEERRTVLKEAHEETLRLAQLVDALLRLARADAHTDQMLLPVEKVDRREESPTVVEVDRVLLQMVRQLRVRLQAEESPLKLEIGQIEPVRIQCDEESLRRILLILLDNALKYTPPGIEGKGRVTVSLQRSGDEAVVQVRDTGIGISKDDLPHIFERFYRADPARSRQGTGLGLSIAQMLVEQLNGRITVESVPGEGSTFSLWLPVR